MENAKIQRMFQHCNNYSICTKKCAVSGEYVARKNSCEKNFKEVK